MHILLQMYFVERVHYIPRPCTTVLVDDFHSSFRIGKCFRYFCALALHTFTLSCCGPNFGWLLSSSLWCFRHLQVAPSIVSLPADLLRGGQWDSSSGPSQIPFVSAFP